MKIAFVLDHFPSLTETFIARDIEALRRHGLTIEIFALRAGEGARQIAAPTLLSSLWWRGVGEKLAGGERAAYFKAGGAEWWRGLGQEATTFEHIHAGWASHPALLAWGAAQAAGLPWSFSGHARDLFVIGGDLAGKLAAAEFAAVCTRAGAEFLARQAPEFRRKIIHAPHGVDLEAIPFHEWAPSNAPLLLAVGRLVEKKGFNVLLDALAILKAQGFVFSAQILGDGPLRASLSTRRDRLDLRECVQLPGALPQPEVLSTMRAAHCLAVPSIIAPDGDRDGLPNVVLEAAACGLPIVATRTGAIEEFVDENTGLLCSPGNATALAAAIHAVFSDADATHQRCRVARQRVAHKFDWMSNAAILARAFYLRSQV